MFPLQKVAGNPFLDVPLSFRMLFAAYILGWRIYPSLAGLSAIDIVDMKVAAALVFFEIFANLLLLLPFLLTSFAGTPIGWLHPLVMPTVMFCALNLIAFPENLLLPFFCWEPGHLVPAHILLEGVSFSNMHLAELKLSVMNFLAIVFTYIGFSLFGFQVSREKVVSILDISVFRLLLVFFVCLFVVAFFIHKQGGIINHMASLAMGRFDMREINGQFLVLNKFLPYILLVLYLHQPSVLRKPLFAFAFVLVSLSQFVVSGSRSGLFAPVASLLIAWMYVNKKVPAKRAILLGVLGITVLSTLGDVRRSGRDGEIDVSAITSFNVFDAWKASQDEIESRALNPDLAVIAMVPKHEDYIYGSTYLAAIGFFVPRVIWLDKPRGGGAHAAAILYEGEDTAERYSGAAYPISGVAEAYWSFDVFGVVILFLFYGLSLRFVVVLVLRRPNNEFVAAVLILFLVAFNSPSTDELVATFQLLFLIAVTKIFVTTKRESRKELVIF